MGVQFNVQGNTNNLDPSYAMNLIFSSGMAGESAYNIVSGGVYYLGGYMLGPIYTYKEDNADVLEGKLLIGIININQEAIQTIRTDLFPPYDPWPVSFPSHSMSTFGVELGLTYKYTVFKRFYITLNLACTMGYFNEAENEYPTPPALAGLMELISGSGGIEFKL